MKYWFVNQGKSFKEEIMGGFIYAPKTNSNGLTFPHWSNLQKVKTGDIIFCNKNGYIKAIGIALSNGYEATIPDSIKGYWQEKGFKADVEYHLLSSPFYFRDFKNDYMQNINLEKNPFAVNGRAKMGYLYPVEKRIAGMLLSWINDEKINNRIAYKNIDRLEELQEEQGQLEKINSGIVKGYNESEIIALENQKYTYKSENIDKKASREKIDPRLKATRMEWAHFNCEIDHNHKSFTCVSGKHQYLECHHIIPLNAQKDFPNIKLDSMFNIIALCPLCHSKVHYAIIEERYEIFKLMYEIRKKEMLDHGFDMEKINQIFNKYY